MPTVRYTTIEGEVIAEKRGGVRRQYVPDPLGSTVALLDSTQAQTDTFQYWPYGEEAVRTGTTATPFRYVGIAGYHRDNANQTYVRARYISPAIGRWLTQDTVGRLAGLNPYLYVSCRVVTLSDPSGMQSPPFRTGDPVRGSDVPGHVKCPDSVAAARQKLCQLLFSKGRDGIKATGCVTGPNQADCLLDWCRDGGGNVYCISDSKWPFCKDACAGSVGHPGTQHPGNGIMLCVPSGLKCGGTIYHDPKNILMVILLHEVMGICGSQHHPPDSLNPYEDVCENRAECLLSAMGINEP